MTDLVLSEMSRLRPGEIGRTMPSDEDWRIDADGRRETCLGADSLELLALSAALAGALHIHRSGIEDFFLARRSIRDWVETSKMSLERFDAEISFRTSGSTGEGKLCTHSLRSLREEVNFFAGMMPATRILSTVPSHHIYGFLFTILLPTVISHIGVVEVIDIRGRSPASLAAIARSGDLIVAFPNYWRAVAAIRPSLPRGVRGLMSTARCDPQIFDDLISLGVDSIIEIYGSSETSGLGWRSSAKKPFQLLPYWQRRSAEMIRRPLSGSDWAEVEPPDILEWTDHRRFMPMGRQDSVVQVGGINVSLDRVRRIICDHPLVSEAAVRPMKPAEGDRLKAFIVPVQGAPPQPRLRESLADWVEINLTPAERPRSLCFGTALPRTQTGKLADWPTAENPP